jgi:hypothetical protein
LEKNTTRWKSRLKGIFNLDTKKMLCSFEKNENSALEWLKLSFFRWLLRRLFILMLNLYHMTYKIGLVED